DAAIRQDDGGHFDAALNASRLGAVGVPRLGFLDQYRRLHAVFARLVLVSGLRENAAAGKGHNQRCCHEAAHGPLLVRPILTQGSLRWSGKGQRAWGWGREEGLPY